MYQEMTMEPRRISKKGLKIRKLSTGTDYLKKDSMKVKDSAYRHYNNLRIFKIHLTSITERKLLLL